MNLMLKIILKLYCQIIYSVFKTVCLSKNKKTVFKITIEQSLIFNKNII